MNHSIQAIYENGLLRPLEPLDLEENSVVEIDVRDVEESSANKKEWLKEFDDWMNSLDPDTPNLTDDQISRESIYSEQIRRHR